MFPEKIQSITLLEAPLKFCRKEWKNEVEFAMQGLLRILRGHTDVMGGGLKNSFLQTSGQASGEFVQNMSLV